MSSISSIVRLFTSLYWVIRDLFWKRFFYVLLWVAVWLLVSNYSFAVLLNDISWTSTDYDSWEYPKIIPSNPYNIPSSAFYTSVWYSSPRVPAFIRTGSYTDIYFPFLTNTNWKWSYSIDNNFWSWAYDWLNIVEFPRAFAQLDDSAYSLFLHSSPTWNGLYSNKYMEEWYFFGSIVWNYLLYKQFVYNQYDHLYLVDLLDNEIIVYDVSSFDSTFTNFGVLEYLNTATPLYFIDWAVTLDPQRISVCPSWTSWVDLWYDLSWWCTKSTWTWYAPSWPIDLNSWLRPLTPSLPPLPATDTQDLQQCTDTAKIAQWVITDLRQCMFQTHLNTYLTWTGLDYWAIISPSFSLWSDMEYLDDLSLIVSDSVFCSSAVNWLKELYTSIDPALSINNNFVYKGLINEIVNRNTIDTYSPFNVEQYCIQKSVYYWTNNGMPPGRVPPHYGSWSFTWDVLYTWWFTFDGILDWPFGYLWWLFSGLNFTSQFTLPSNEYWQYCKSSTDDMQTIEWVIWMLLILFMSSFILSSIKH